MLKHELILDGRKKLYSNNFFFIADFCQYNVTVTMLKKKSRVQAAKTAAREGFYGWNCKRSGYATNCFINT
jgi:hypothetical protein